MTATPPNLTSSVSTFRLGYRPELDGLRGISIILVMILHANFIKPGLPFFMSGGFIGVDIFFVLSGFLITSLILEEYGRTSTVNLTNFYARRALRLLPVIFAVLAFSVFAGYLVGFTWLGITNLRLVSVLGYFTNWLYAFESPDLWFLAHLWSLAIEEQFYLLWPALLIVLLRLARRVAILIVAGLATASCLWMAVLYFAGSSEARLFVGFDTHGHVLLIGCLASLAMYWKYLPSALTSPRKLFGWTKASAVILIAVAFTAWEKSPFLYVGGLAVVGLATATVIVWLISAPSKYQSVFRWPVLLWLGKRSYGLYVWHWPIYYLSRKWENAALAIIFGVVASVVMAALSYRFIEVPFLKLKSTFTSQMHGRMAAQFLDTPGIPGIPGSQFPLACEQRTQGHRLQTLNSQADP